MQTQRRSPARARRRLVWLASMGAVLVVLALIAWQLASSSPEQQTLNPLPAAPSPRQDASAGGGVADEPRPTEGASRAPVARVEGRRVWFAPSPDVEADLPQVKGPLPSVVPVDRGYPPLRAGDVRRALMVMGVVDDTATLTRILVLDESWQVFEMLPSSVGGPTRRTMSPGALSPDGTRVALGLPGGYVVVDLRDLGTRLVGVADVGPRDLSWSRGTVVLGDGPTVRGDRSTGTAKVVVTDGIPGVTTQSDRPSAVVVDRPGRAMLVLDGARSISCCAVAGRPDRDHVLYESRTGPRLHVLSWDTTTGMVALVSTVEPVVSTTWYIVTSYSGL